jgi:methylthioribose-1-phosphate isomerase
MSNFYHKRTVEWGDGKVILIDQKKLPNRLSYIECERHQQVAKSILEMNIRGAPAIGVAAAMGLALVAYYSKAETKKQLLEELRKAGQDFIETRPTAANLQWGINRIYDFAVNSKETEIEKLKQVIIDESKKMGDEDVKINKTIGKQGSKLINDGDTVLTHCK